MPGFVFGAAVATHETAKIRKLIDANPFRPVHEVLTPDVRTQLHLQSLSEVTQSDINGIRDEALTLSKYVQIINPLAQTAKAIRMSQIREQHEEHAHAIFNPKLRREQVEYVPPKSQEHKSLVVPEGITMARLPNFGDHLPSGESRTRWLKAVYQSIPNLAIQFDTVELAQNAHPAFRVVWFLVCFVLQRGNEKLPQVAGVLQFKRVAERIRDEEVQAPTAARDHRIVGASRHWAQSSVHAWLAAWLLSSFLKSNGFSHYHKMWLPILPIAFELIFGRSHAEVVTMFKEAVNLASSRKAHLQLLDSDGWVPNNLREGYNY